ncbi:hypothetical protein BAE44_0005472, partial [Dichanthelium oligosanthes]
LPDAALPPRPSDALRDDPERPPRNRPLLCNKARLPMRVPITIAVTPPVARALSHWRVVKS